MTAAERGARAGLRLAADPALQGVTGRFYRRETPVRTPPVSYGPATQRRLLALSDAHLAR